MKIEELPKAPPTGGAFAHRQLPGPIENPELAIRIHKEMYPNEAIDPEGWIVASFGAVSGFYAMDKEGMDPCLYSIAQDHWRQMIASARKEQEEISVAFMDREERDNHLFGLVNEIEFLKSMSGE